MKRFPFVLCLLLTSAMIFQTACKTPDDTPAVGTYIKGVYITNEGKYPGSGDVSFYDRTIGGITTDIFAKANSGAAAGSVIQSMTYLNRDTAFLIANNSNKILYVNPHTFQVFDSISIVYPRYVNLVTATRCYISAGNGTTSATDSVYVFNYNTKTILKSIPVNGLGPDKMLSYGSKRYVINTGGYKTDASVTVIDAYNIYADSVLTQIKLSTVPTGITSDANGDIWVLCDYYAAPGKSKLYQIRNDVVIATFPVADGANNLTVDASANNLYYTVGNKIYTKNLLNFTVNQPQLYMTQPYFQSVYGLGFDPSSGYMYCADAKDYASRGSVYIFDPTKKTLIDSVKVGIAPSNFLFN